MPKIHPTAIVSPEARLADDVTIGPFALVDGPVTLGAGTVIKAYAHLAGPLTMGARNVVFPGAVLGEGPQDRKYKGEFSETIIGDDNVFRENVTVHRGTGLNTRTVVGNRNYFMVNSHVGHNCVVGDDVTLVNGAAIGGHSSIGNQAILGGYCSLHQGCRIGRLAMIANATTYNVDFPPFFLSMATNTVNQLNAVGLRRAGMSRSSINGLRRMLQIAFRQHHARPLQAALASLPPDLLEIPEVQEVIAFCKSSKRGVARYIPWSRMKNLLEKEVLQAE